MKVSILILLITLIAFLNSVAPAGQNPGNGKKRPHSSVGPSNKPIQEHVPKSRFSGAPRGSVGYRSLYDKDLRRFEVSPEGVVEKYPKGVTAIGLRYIELHDNEQNKYKVNIGRVLEKVSAGTVWDIQNRPYRLGTNNEIIEQPPDVPTEELRSLELHDEEQRKYKVNKDLVAVVTAPTGRILLDAKKQEYILDANNRIVKRPEGISKSRLRILELYDADGNKYNIGKNEVVFLKVTTVPKNPSSIAPGAPISRVQHSGPPSIAPGAPTGSGNPSSSPPRAQTVSKPPPTKIPEGNFKDFMTTLK